MGRRWASLEQSYRVMEAIRFAAFFWEANAIRERHNTRSKCVSAMWFIFKCSRFINSYVRWVPLLQMV